jgi:hypothetical protein
MKHLRQIHAKLKPTIEGGSILVIFEPSKGSNERSKTKSFPYCTETDNVQEQAGNLLETNGFTIDSFSWSAKGYIFNCDNWANEFINIKDIKS